MGRDRAENRLREHQGDLIRKQNRGSISLGKRPGDNKKRGAEAVKATPTAAIRGWRSCREGRGTVPAGSPEGCGDPGHWLEFKGLFQFNISTGKPTAWPTDVVGCGWREPRAMPGGMQGTPPLPGCCSSDSELLVSEIFFLVLRAGFALGSCRRAPGAGLFTGINQGNSNLSPVPDALGVFRYGRQTSKQLSNSTEP